RARAVPRPGRPEPLAAAAVLAARKNAAAGVTTLASAGLLPVDSPRMSGRSRPPMQITTHPRDHARKRGRLRPLLGWCVHFYTALGLVCAAAIAADVVKGTPASYRRAFVFMLIATVIDATDGTLARAVRIKEAVPSFDGRRLDDIIDYLTYTFLPLGLIWRADLLPAGYEA